MDRSSDEDRNLVRDISVFDITSFLAAFLLGFAFLLTTFGVVLLVIGPAINLGLSCLLASVLLGVPCLTTLLRLFRRVPVTCHHKQTRGNKRTDAMIVRRRGKK